MAHINWEDIEEAKKEKNETRENIYFPFRFVSSQKPERWKRGRIHGTSRSPFSFLPAAFQMDGSTDRRTNRWSSPIIEVVAHDIKMMKKVENLDTLRENLDVTNSK